MSTIILAIESSCDETAAAVCRDGKILSNIIAGQKVHEQYGGVVPELASRAHIQNIVPVVERAIADAGLSAGDLSKAGLPAEDLSKAGLSAGDLSKGGYRIQDMDAIAFTQSPGLIGSLLVGTQFAKSLALSINKPLIAVHHMQAHVLANLIEEPKPDFPFLCLTVSGGHTQIVLCESPIQMKVIGETIDDAAGEAFDKSAKMLGLPYPGGPLIDKYALQGNPDRYQFPEPQIPGLDFSFSGLKTSILYFLQNAGKTNVYKEEFKVTDVEKKKFIKDNLPDICASIQHRIITILLNKLKSAAIQTNIKNICIAGGVSANSGLRKAFEEIGKKYHWKTFIPKLEYCTDNAAMIAVAGYYKYLSGEFNELSVSASARATW